MSHTDRDQLKYVYKHHNETCHNYWRNRDAEWHWLMQWCECDAWFTYHWYSFPVPAWWNRDCRREERAKERNLMQRARAGHVEWDDLPLGGNASRHYRRPYYW